MRLVTSLAQPIVWLTLVKGMQDAHSHFGPGPQQRSNAAMSREELRQISHRLSGILRYRVEEKGLTADSEGFVPFEDVCRACHRHDRRVIYTAAVNSVGEDGPRFEFRAQNWQQLYAVWKALLLRAETKMERAKAWRSPISTDWCG